MNQNQVPQKDNVNKEANSSILYPLPIVHENPKRGSKIHRTMEKLTTSTIEDRKTIKILFYGQSITKQLWTKQLSDYLKVQFPYVDFDVKNLAVGGFDATRLVRIVKNDVIRFYPDLVIFHVYGIENKYKEIVSIIKENTTAEIMLQDDHVRAPHCEEWDQHDSWSFFKLPAIAEQYGCEPVLIRKPWKDYLESHQLDANDLLLDGSHLNEHGDFLMAELLKPYFYFAEPSQIVTYENYEKTYIIGADIHWENGTIVLPFSGNRVDFVASGDLPANIEVLLDDEKPTNLKEGYFHTRPNDFEDRVWAWEGYDWPWETGTVKRITWENCPLEEEWILTFTKVSDDIGYFEYEVIGSLTGYDGKGNNGSKFISNSGRVVIEPEDWFIKTPHDIVFNMPVAKDFTVKWKTVSMCKDQYSGFSCYQENQENTVTIIQCTSNTHHILRLNAVDGLTDRIKAIKVFSPTI